MLNLLKKYLPLIKKYTPIACGIYLLGWVHFGLVEKAPVASVFVFIACITVFILATKENNANNL